jgi:hypothetical protein
VHDVTAPLAVQAPGSNGCSPFASHRILSEGYESQSWLAVLNGSASDQLEPFEKEAVEKANTTKVQELLGQLQ